MYSVQPKTEIKLRFRNVFRPTQNRNNENRSKAAFSNLSGVVWTGPKEKNRDKRLKFLDDFRQFPIRLGTPDCTLTLDI